MPRLARKRCVVTGAARGIGAAIATAFVAEGASVVLTDIDVSTGAATAATLGMPFHRHDVRFEADWTAFAAVAQQIDVLVNNAGITGFEGGPVPHDPETTSLADWRAVLATNLDGVFLGCRRHQYAVWQNEDIGKGRRRQRGGPRLSTGQRVEETQSAFPGFGHDLAAVPGKPNLTRLAR